LFRTASTGQLDSGRTSALQSSSYLERSALSDYIFHRSHRDHERSRTGGKITIRLNNYWTNTAATPTDLFMIPS
jgi:hypothetical protein